MNEKTVTVFTPAYNRAHTLMRAYKSLQQQTVRDFEWLIIDDGSTDNTKELVQKMIEEADFTIRYYWKENGGRHTAVNYSYQYLRTPYVITLDSDDELMPDCIENIIRIWNEIPKEDYDRFWCISGREVNATTGQMVGKPWPEGINKLKGRKQRKVILKYSGEKHCCRKVAIHVQYPFPVYPDTKFVSENTVWEVINRKYDQYCVNDIFGKYHTESEDSLSNGGMHHETHYKTGYYYGLFYVNTLFDEFFMNYRVPFHIVDVSRCAILSRTPYRTVMRSLNSVLKKCLVTVGYPISAVWVLFHLDKMK